MKQLILIVDDEPINILLLTEYLRGSGYEIIAAENGFRALDYLEQFVPKLVLLDVAMPGLNGIEVLENIMSNEKTKEVPVIMISANVEPDTVETALTLGAKYYANKPIIKQDLLNLIQVYAA